MAQIGIALGALGMMLAAMGLFPGITGIETGRGIGLVQITAIVLGFALLDLGAFLYVKFTIYPGRPSNLAQQVGTRLALTGIVLGSMAGLADFLGFGSHGPVLQTTVYFGSIQALLVLVCIGMSTVGILVYAVSGEPPEGTD